MTSLCARPFRRVPAWRIAAAAVVLTALSIGATVSQASMLAGWRAGEPAEIPLVLEAPARATLAAAALDLARRLGLPGTPAPAVRALDRTLGRAFDTINLSSPDGRLATVITNEAATGRLHSAVRLAWSADLDVQRIGSPEAGPAARRFLILAGLAVPATTASTAWDDGMDAWRVRWARRIDGLEAPGDGLVVWVHRGGQLKAISDVETALAPVPAAPISKGAAAAAIGAYLQRTGIDGMAGLAIEEPTLGWAEANDFIDSTLPDAPAPTLRLAWLVRLSYVPPGWTERHFLELRVDAGTGQLIGGTETA
ncbi:MAG: hypothetical protein ACXWQ6_01000 [Candidatus Limnocylindrales bacterium]